MKLSNQTAQTVDLGVGFKYGEFRPVGAKAKKVKPKKAAKKRKKVAFKSILKWGGIGVAAAAATAAVIVTGGAILPVVGPALIGAAKLLPKHAPKIGALIGALKNKDNEGKSLADLAGQAGLTAAETAEIMDAMSKTPEAKAGAAAEGKPGLFGLPTWAVVGGGVVVAGVLAIALWPKKSAAAYPPYMPQMPYYPPAQMMPGPAPSYAIR